ncbi:PIN domain-containing protein [Zunongwangia sp. F363]|uniref:PIN domain-containing protein n=1 Tax=Autumnicola tepida TaxID=3075595 RepID=A0ABU3CAS5_9FLAO|nr:PIN domain-containing protein [Zunongwangia sp. F363]MDT0643302.1 PIN domain-containing protein [Zunongwangia sp. F363]
MIIIVDTNIVFSGILNPEGDISDILLNSGDIFQFYSPGFLLEELEKHHQKLLQISGYSETDLNFLKISLLKKIEFINPEFIQQSNWVKAAALAKDVDAYDIPFIALGLQLNAPLWTGDKKLMQGLQRKGYNSILNTKLLEEIRDKK